MMLKAILGLTCSTEGVFFEFITGITVGYDDISPSIDDGIVVR
jgi:hypothetical protein